MVSTFEMWALVAVIAVVICFLIRVLSGEKPRLIHKIYIAASFGVMVWALATLVAGLSDSTDISMLMICDAFTYLGGATIPVFSLLTVLTFVNNWEKLPKWVFALFALPLVTNIIVWTNSAHHLFYKVFSMMPGEVVFGPWLVVSAIYSFGCLMVSTAVIIRFAVRSRTRLYIRQAVLLMLGNMIPLIVNACASLRLFNLGYAATPIAFMATIVFHGLAIYFLHFLDIKPVATQKVLDWISDCFLITGEEGLIVSYNKPFFEVFGKQHAIEEGKYLKDCLKDEDVQNKTGLYNLMTSIESCRSAGSNIFYEQAVVSTAGAEVTKRFYMVEIAPLIINGAISGYAAIFKDVTRVKEGMERLQASQVRLMERERLASLGQMMGGMAHNLKTPIMSISGSVSAIENLVAECRASVGDPEVTAEDYNEIYGEAGEWLTKIRDACTYMSDIISAVKGQATTMDVGRDLDFTVEELIKRVHLLLRHELQNSGCTLITDNRAGSGDILLHGDVNNLVQVVNNLVTNAVDAQIPNGPGNIVIRVEKTAEGALEMTVRDNGTGISPEVKKRLFNQMVTSKGTMGTGLGLYISNVVVRGKFGGHMWAEDNPGGGTVVGFSIPAENVSFEERTEGQE